MRVSNGEELFNAWRDLAYRVKALGSIVQNDMEITVDDFSGWLDYVEQAKNMLAALAEKTHEHILRGE